MAIRLTEKFETFKRYRRVVGIRGVIRLAIARLRKKPHLLQIRMLGVNSPVYLRVPSSDVQAFAQIFIANEYKVDVNRDPEFIIDAGANIGLASIYFANQFPNARILAIEPEMGNFEILAKNVETYPNIQPVLGALWGERAEVEVIEGAGNWGFTVETQSGSQTSKGSTGRRVQGMTVDMILENYGVERISILKMDIEGAEVEVFRDSSSWIDRVDSLIVELHERTKPGCNQSFYSATGGFDIEWLQGDLVYRTRTGGCLKNIQSGYAEHTLGDLA
jgi:FkbM family methyltransferase